MSKQIVAKFVRARKLMGLCLSVVVVLAGLGWYGLQSVRAGSGAVGQAGRWLINTQAASLAAVTSKANELWNTALLTSLPGGKKDSGMTLLHVSTEQELRDALAATTGAQNGDSVIFDADITLSRDLPAVQNSITINGNGHFLDGASAHRGLFVYSGTVTIQNLAIQNAVAQGGTGAGGGGGGAGLGGALFVNTGANVTISGVSFNGNAAKGGSGYSFNIGGGGGGGLGGDGGRGGGGIGSEADGGTASTPTPGTGIVTGAASGGGAEVGQSGGANGGGGATSTNSDGGGGGGGVNGSAGSGVNGGAGGFGGGAGGSGGAGGFGGGGGSGDGLNNGLGGAGGFGGGGGGGAQATVGFGGFGAGLGGVNAAAYAEIAACNTRCAPPPPPGGGGGGSVLIVSIGGGGLGAGGAVFVRNGGSLSVSGALTETGSTVTAGQSYRPDNGGAPVNPCDCLAVAYRNAGSLGFDGAAFGSGLFLQGNGTLSFAPGQGESQSIGGVIADQTGSGGTNGNAGSWSLSKSGAGTLSLNAANTFTGGTTLNAGTLSLGAATSAGTGAVTFAAGQTATLRVNAASVPTNTIKGFGSGHTINLANAGLATNASLGANNVLTITGGTVSPITLNLDPAQNFSSAVFKLATDNNGGTALTLTPPCPASCDDNNACTIDSCDPMTGSCYHTAVICDDSNACTIDTCDPVRGCVFTPINCDDGDPNTADSCHRTRGCVNTPCTANPVVTNTNDSGAGSLREAIATACPGSTISFQAGISLITLTSGELVINKNLTIQGPGANLLTVQRSAAQGTAEFRIFTINSGVTATLDRLTMANGKVSGADARGGGIHNRGTLTISNSTLSGNTAAASGGANNSSFGGGILNEGGTLNVTGSTLSGNTASASGGSNSASHGGGIINFGGGTLNMSNSTLSGNTASASGGSNNNSYGGGIYNDSTLNATNSTLSGNAASASGGSNSGNGGGIFSNGGTVKFRNTLIAGNTVAGSATLGPDVRGAVTSQGHNLIGKTDNSSGWVAADKTGTGTAPLDAKLAPLANYGGPTQTHALLPGSLAMNAGNDCVLTANGCGANDPPTALTTDQRGTGFNRQDGSAVDIGAFESRGFIATVSGGNNQSAAITTAFANPLAVTVSSSFGEPVQGGVVYFTAPVSGASATFTGTPATINGAGQASVTATANQVAGGYQVTASGPGLVARFNLTNACPSFTLGTPTATGTVNTTYSSSVAASPAAPNGFSYQYVLANVTSLPAGLMLNTATGAITGTPTAPGNVNFDIRAELFNGNMTTGCVVTQAFSINIACGVTNPVVTTNADNGAGSLREAISIACHGGTITFANGINLITLTSGELVINKNLTIQGPGASLLTISGNQAARVFSIGGSGSTANVTLSGLRIANGQATHGGGIYNQEGTVNLTNSTLSGNSATGFLGGGGIYNAQGTINLTNSTLSTNMATGLNGGAIYHGSGTLTLNNSTLSNNSATGGSGGGGIYLQGGTVKLTNSALSNNSANNGGGIYVVAGMLSLTGSTLAGNSATGFFGGGGIYLQGGTITFSNSTLSGNSTTKDGGGIYLQEATLNLTSSTLAGNSATGSQGGGGIFVQNSNRPLNARNTIIANNTASNGPDVSGTLNSHGYNLIGNTSVATITGTTTGNILNASALLAPLGNYGGPTQTHALLPGSPAINAGSNALAVDENNQPLTTDQRGTGFNRQVSGTVDIGAFESRGFTLTVSGGNNQSAAITTAFANPLAVTVSSSFGEPVQGGIVNFTSPASGASATLTGTPATLNATGQASVTATANNVPGAYQVTASANGLTSVSFALSNTCPGITLGTPTPTGTLNTAYSSSVAASPAAPNGFSYQYSLANGTSLPAGLMLNAATGAITGTPTAPGQVNFAIKAELFNGATTTGCVVTQAFSINITCTNNPVVQNGNDSGVGSLREAIAIACPGSTITFANGINLVTLTSGELVIAKNLTIQGPGANLLTVQRSAAQGTPDFRIFNIGSGVTVQLNDLTIANGKLSSTFDNGGGIYNLGALTLTNSALSGNSISGGQSYGGGIHNEGRLTLTNSTLSGNSIRSDAAFGYGGGIYNLGTLTLTNSTLSGNSANGVIYNVGGGIYNLGTLTLTNSTLSGNSAIKGADTNGGGGGGGGIYMENGLVKTKNTIIAGNSAPVGPDVAGAVTSQGYNLIGKTDDSSGWVATDKTGTVTAPLDAKLAPLANYGGPTQTHALLPGSPALNAGSNALAVDENNQPLTTDQRGTGFNRQVSGTVDIGAFESRGFTLTVSGGNNQTALVNTAFAQSLSVTITPLDAGEPVNGGQVSFTPPTSDARATIAGVPATISNGQATTGTVTANDTPGTYQVTASASGAAAVTFTLTNNSPPTIAAQSGLARQQGSPAANAQIATALDAEDAAPALQVTVNGGASAMVNGLTVSNIQVAANGSVTAAVVASCTATNATFTLTVTDSAGGSAMAILIINVTTNTPPALGTYPAGLVTTGGATIVTPNQAPTDNGTVTLTAAAPGFTGAFSGNATTGGITVTNAAPAGTYTVTVTATDNCAATTSTTFQLTVNSPPTISGAIITRQQNNPISNSQIATVNDHDQAENTLVVTINAGAAATVNGVTVNNLVVAATGAVTAAVVASCAATNASFTLTVTDSSGASNSALLTVNVTPETTPPTITCPGNQLSVTNVNAPNTPVAVTWPAPMVHDNCPGATFSCTPPSGSSFPLGTTNVTCQATDAGSNTASCSFTVTVRQPRAAITNLIARVQTYVPPLTQTQANGLKGQLEQANTRVEQGQITLACTHLQNFVNGVVSLTPPLTTAAAQDLTKYANKIRNALGCTGGPFATFRAETVGVYLPQPGEFKLKNGLTSGPAELSASGGEPEDQPVAGDWDGDGIDTFGVYRHGVFYLRNTGGLTAAPREEEGQLDKRAEVVVAFGQAGDVPVVGDWDGDGIDTIGVYRQGQFLLRNTNTAGAPELVIQLGGAGDLPLAGDWDGDGVVTVGIYQAGNGAFQLRNGHTEGAGEVLVLWGGVDYLPIVGDWDGDGMTTVGLYSRTGEFLLRNTNTAGPAEIVLTLGLADGIPLAGDWDGLP